MKAVREILYKVNINKVIGDTGTLIRNVVSDSREVTKKDLYIFIVNDVKSRSSKKPIHRECFGLDIKEIENFRNLLAGVSGLPGLVICQVLFSL